LSILLYLRAQLFVTVFGSALVVVSCFSFATQKNANQPIRLVTNDWSSQIVLAHIAGGIFEQLGYQVQYSSSSVDEQWGAMALGLEHVQTEVWEGTMSDMFTRMVDVGRLVDAGSHAAVTREEWWYPDYVEELCPGLPDWKALKSCSALFSEDGSSTGRYYAGPWEKPEAARIRALGMNFIADTVGGADELWQALESASKTKRPIVLFNWTPNWVEARYKGKFVEFPSHEPACETDPAWGINPNYHYDCGNPAQGWLKKAVWSGMGERWPCAFQTFTNFSFDNLSIAQLAARVDVDGLTYKAAAVEWLNLNESLWQSWIGESCAGGETS